MMNKRELSKLAMQQCAIELGCNAADFQREENIVVTPCMSEGRRHFISGTFFFQMVTFGKNTVISADERMHPFLCEYVKDKKGFWLFEEPHIIKINRELEKHGKSIWSTAHSYMPDMKIINQSHLCDVRWFEKDQIAAFYPNDAFPNALQHKEMPLRPDVLAVASYDGDKITGMAGASADTELMWQIGIDVLPEYRSRGLAAYLVTLLKNEIIRRGKIPYYGTSNANIFSQNVARTTGFFPAWTEAYSMEAREDC